MVDLVTEGNHPWCEFRTIHMSVYLFRHRARTVNLFCSYISFYWWESYTPTSHSTHGPSFSCLEIPDPRPSLGPLRVDLLRRL